MSEFRVDKITNQAGTSGPEIAGITTFTGTSGMVIPSGPTEYRGNRGRGISGGYYASPYTGMNYIDIATTGNGTDFGDMVNGGCWGVNSLSSSTRGLFAGGYISPTGSLSQINQVIISSGGGTIDFGNLKQAFRQPSCAADSTRGVFGGISVHNPAYEALFDIRCIKINSQGQEEDFGEISISTKGGVGFGDMTRGVFKLGGYGQGPTSGNNNIVEYVTIQTKGNSIDFGDSTYLIGYSGAAGGSRTRGIIGGAYSTEISAPHDRAEMDYFSIQSKGNGIDFGNLTTTRHGGTGLSNKIRLALAGGYTAGATDVIDYVQIATLGDAVDFGDLTYTQVYTNGFSDSHGGLE